MHLDINIDLLKQELNRNSHSLILHEIVLTEYLDINHVSTIILALIDLISTDQIHSSHDVYKIRTIEDFLIIKSLDFIKNIKDLNQEKKLISLIIFLTLSLNKVSPNSFNFLLMSLDLVEEFQDYKIVLSRYIDSLDYRGLYYWLCSNIFNESFYDESIKKIDYEYFPAKVTPQWLNKHRENNEPMEFWFYDTLLGKSLFLILFTPKCRYAKCSGCNLPSLSSQESTTSASAVYKQVDTLLENMISKEEKHSIKEVLLSNNGNLFDIKTMPTLSLLYSINILIESLPSLEKIVIESRIEYLTEYQLKTIQEVLSTHTDRKITIEIALGFEIFDDDIRNGYYNKGFYKSALEKLMPLFSKYNTSLKFYMMYKAVPGMSVEDAISDINNVTAYASDLVKKNDININIHISPTYVAAGTLLEMEFNKGSYIPPNVKDITLLCDKLNLHDNISYYISLNDEGLSTTHIEDEYKQFLLLKRKIEHFNINQKFIS